MADYLVLDGDRAVKVSSINAVRANWDSVLFYVSGEKFYGSISDDSDSGIDILEALEFWEFVRKSTEKVIHIDGFLEWRKTL